MTLPDQLHAQKRFLIHRFPFFLKIFYYHKHCKKIIPSLGFVKSLNSMYDGVILFLSDMIILDQILTTKYSAELYLHKRPQISRQLICELFLNRC